MICISQLKDGKREKQKQEQELSGEQDSIMRNMYAEVEVAIAINEKKVLPITRCSAFLTDMIKNSRNEQLLLDIS